MLQPSTSTENLTVILSSKESLRPPHLDHVEEVGIGDVELRRER